MEEPDHNTPNLPTDKIFEYFIRALGVAILLAGLLMCLKVATTAKDLYDDRSAVTKFAQEIEEASRLNKTFEIIVQKMRRMGADPGEKREETGCDLCYFLSWLLLLLILGIIARIGLAAMAEGGKLALAGMLERKFAKSLAREIFQESVHWQVKQKVESIARDAVAEMLKSNKNIDQ